MGLRFNVNNFYLLSFCKPSYQVIGKIGPTFEDWKSHNLCQHDLLEKRKVSPSSPSCTAANIRWSGNLPFHSIFMTPQHTTKFVSLRFALHVHSPRIFFLLLTLSYHFFSLFRGFLYFFLLTSMTQTSDWMTFQDVFTF